MKIFYLLPGYYFYITRLNNLQSFLGWILGYFIPIIFYIFFILNNNNFLEILISSLIIIAFYEIGYLRNDIFTSSKEKNPTLRIKDKSLFKIYKNSLFEFISMRIIFLIFFIIFIQNFQLLILIIINQIFFIVHNLFRSQLNIFSFFLVNQTKNISFLFISNQFIFFDIFLIIIIFFYRSIENLSRPIFSINNKILKMIHNNNHIFRVIYFLLMIIIMNLFYNLGIFYQILMMYMLFLRLAFLIYVKAVK